MSDERDSRPDAERLIAEGNRLEERGDVRGACERYASAVSRAPRHAGAHLNLGIGLESLGELERAAAAYETALELDPASPYPAYNLGKLAYRRGDAARAEALLRSAIARKPGFAEASVLLSSLLDAQQRAGEACELLDGAIAARPDYALAHYWRGNALIRLGRPEAALAAYQRAVALEPELAPAWCNLGNVLNDFGRREEARNALARALALDPASADAEVGLGNVHAAEQDFAQAAEHYRRSVALDPRHAQALVNLGNALKYEGRRAEALACFARALELEPASAQARWSNAMAQIPVMRAAGESLADSRRRFGEELEALERWFDASRAAAGAQAVGIEQPFWLAYQEQDNRALLARYGTLCARLMGEWQRLEGLRPAARRGGARLRIGIVSQYFREHSVWQAIIKGWLRALDPARFELSAFSLGGTEDRETAYARSRVARFVRAAGGLRHCADAIVAAQPEVLVYPEIGMDPMTQKLASLRLAPVQAVSWGHPETSGLPTIDLYLSAQAFEPEGAQAHYTERLVALPNLGCYVEPSAIEPIPPQRGQHEIAAGAPLLLCPGTPFKYAPEHDRVLVEIARRLGACRLVFFAYRSQSLDAILRERLAGAFGEADFQRFVRIVPWQTKAQFHGWLRSADVYLDTIGFSGFNTALQAVECGLPVVTLEGRFMRARLASGILKRLGLQELVAATAEEYIQTAVKLASDRAYREHISREIGKRRGRLFNDQAPIAALEDLLGGLR